MNSLPLVKLLQAILVDHFEEHMIIAVIDVDAYQHRSWSVECFLQDGSYPRILSQMKRAAENCPSWRILQMS
jgi:hypothetical protein